MRREAQIPLFLWVATAILTHLAGGGGAERVAQVIEERLDVKRFVESVRTDVRQHGTGLEVALVDPATLPDPTPRQEPTGKAEGDEEQEDEKPREREKEREKERKPPDRPKPKAETEPRRPPETPPPEVKKPTPPPEVKPEPARPAAGRVAVRQHVEKKDQPDNPNARHIADEANHVEQESRARITSNDQNDPQPSPGGRHGGSDSTPGNSEEHRVADSEDRPGEPDRGPTSEAPATPTPRPATSPPAVARAEQREERTSAARGEASGAESAKGKGRPSPESPGSRTTRPEQAAPALADAASGADGAPEAREARPGSEGRAARRKRLPPPRGRSDGLGLLGLGAAGLSPGGLNLNLTPREALAAVGGDQLARERRADTERRKSKHRGSWRSPGLEKWRSAIENYVASVQPGNQTALNTARVPFASYLAQIHNRLHPIFADSFLASLDSLPSGHPLNQPKLHNNVEIVLNREDGSIVKMGITRPSGVTAFDVASLEAVARAAPFGAPPREIVSPDGNVYLHWEFWRDPYYACSTYFARPFLLKGRPRSAPPRLPGTAPPVTDERPPDGRTGRRTQATPGRTARVEAHGHVQ